MTERRSGVSSTRHGAPARGDPLAHHDTAVARTDRVALALWSAHTRSRRTLHWRHARKRWQRSPHRRRAHARQQRLSHWRRVCA